MFHCTHPSRRQLLGAVAAIAVALAFALSAPAAAAAPTGPWVSIAPAEPGAYIPGATSWSFPRPGVTIASQFSEDESRTCTAGWPVANEFDEVAFLTAGHCQTEYGGSVWMYTSPDKSTRLDLAPLQNAEERTDEQGIKRDSALFFLPPWDGSFSARLAPAVRVHGVLTVDQIRALDPGTPLCMNGARSGVTCGPMLRAGSAEIKWGGYAVKGDSGAPVFVVDAHGRAMAVGMLSRGPTATENYVTYLEPVLTGYGVQLLADGL